MRAVIQRVSTASVTIKSEVKAEISSGLVILLGIHADDTVEDVNWLVNKIIQLRIFSDDQGKMNLSLKDIDGNALIISQFTLFARTKKGTRPSFIESAHPDIAIPIYEQFLSAFKDVLGKEIGSGKFGADMKVSLVNDGPVTITIDTHQKH